MRAPSSVTRVASSRVGGWYSAGAGAGSPHCSSSRPCTTCAAAAPQPSNNSPPATSAGTRGRRPPGFEVIILIPPPAAPGRFGGDRAPATIHAGRDLASRGPAPAPWHHRRSEEHTSELQSLMRSSYAVFCLKNNTHLPTTHLKKT